MDRIVDLTKQLIKTLPRRNRYTDNNGVVEIMLLFTVSGDIASVSEWNGWPFFDMIGHTANQRRQSTESLSSYTGLVFIINVCTHFVCVKEISGSIVLCFVKIKQITKIVLCKTSSFYKWDT